MGALNGEGTILFYRKFKRFRGGHLKVWDYFNHVSASAGHAPRIWFTDNSLWDETNPWSGARELVVEDPTSVAPSAFFLAGRDWALADGELERQPHTPVINLIQHVRHAEPASDRFEFLSRPAVRVCVSEAVADAVQASGRARGPVIAIPNCTDIDALPAPGEREQDTDVLIAALKQPELGAELEARLRRDGRRVVLSAELRPRKEYLNAVARARVTVFLPNLTEGFYLPTLEGMAMGTLVVCPEHGGESFLYEPGRNSFRCPYELEAIAETAEQALALDPVQAMEMQANARAAAEGRSLAVERRRFQEVLGSLDELWAEALG